MTVDVRLRSRNPDLLVGLALARGVRVGEPGAELVALVDDLVARRGDDFPPEATRRAVRDLLRWGGFKPTGRNKPASEYLARAAARDAFPRINAVVDAANLFSLETGLPVSLLDLDRALEGAAALEIREGHAGESFVFNPSGQAIEVAGLVGVARADGPVLGNPVKDSMATRTSADTRSVLAVLYATRRLAEVGDVDRMAHELAALLGRHGEAEQTAAWVLGV